jgi:UDP-N-acetylglucosamine acyltransferase
MIHPTAIISKGAELDSDVSVGPYCVIEGDVQIGKGTKISSHVVIGSEYGKVRIGEKNQIYSGAVIGGPPQDLKYNHEPTRLEIGHNNVIREFVTLNIGTHGGGGQTTIGSNNLLMAYVHVAHDCHLGSHIVIANTTNLAGHVNIDDHVRIGGVCSFNQFVRVGRYAYIAGTSAVNKDILPFSIAQGSYAAARATNKIGLERSGFSVEDVENIHRAIRAIIMGNRTIDEALELIQTDCATTDHVRYFVDFVKTSERGIAR